LSTCRQVTSLIQTCIHTCTGPLCMCLCVQGTSEVGLAGRFGNLWNQQAFGYCLAQFGPFLGMLLKWFWDQSRIIEGRSCKCCGVGSPLGLGGGGPHKSQWANSSPPPWCLGLPEGPGGASAESPSKIGQLRSRTDMRESLKTKFLLLFRQCEHISLPNI